MEELNEEEMKGTEGGASAYSAYNQCRIEKLRVQGDVLYLVIGKKCKNIKLKRSLGRK